MDCHSHFSYKLSALWEKKIYVWYCVCLSFVFFFFSWLLLLYSCVVCCILFRVAPVFIVDFSAVCFESLRRRQRTQKLSSQIPNNNGATLTVLVPKTHKLCSVFSFRFSFLLYISNKNKHRYSIVVFLALAYFHFPPYVSFCLHKTKKEQNKNLSVCAEWSIWWN